MYAFIKTNENNVSRFCSRQFKRFKEFKGFSLFTAGRLLVGRVVIKYRHPISGESWHFNTPIIILEQVMKSNVGEVHCRELSWATQICILQLFSCTKRHHLMVQFWHFTPLANSYLVKYKDNWYLCITKQSINPYKEVQDKESAYFPRTKKHPPLKSRTVARLRNWRGKN